MASTAPAQFREEVVRWQQKLLEIQQSYREKIERQLPVFAVERAEGNYILESENFPFSPVLFREILLYLAPLLTDCCSRSLDCVPLLSRLDDEVLDQLATAVQSSPEQDFADALSLAVDEVRLERRTELPRDILELLLQAAFVPFYSAFARQQDISGQKDAGWCPVCGQLPVNGCNMAEDNSRVLGCWLCNTSWTYSRLACPACQNQDHEKLRVFTVEEQPRHRLQVCSECNHYIKITHDWPQQSYCAMSENATTAYLDILAQQQGYRPASRALCRKPIN